LVDAAHVDNPEVGWEYADVATWGETTVDVKRVYNDISTQAHLISNHSCSAYCSSTGCSTFIQDACGYIRDPELGIIELYPADYSGGVWTRRNCGCGGYGQEQLNYMSGLEMNSQVEDIIVRLAHSKMPKEPCGCEPIRAMWARDRLQLDTYTRERINCPFGTSDGAWIAWRWVENIKLVRGALAL
jgi:hypothetical protein